MKKLFEYLKLSATAAELAWKIFTFGVVVTGGTTAAALAAGTDFFKNLGPLAWLAVAIVAALAFAIILYLVAAAASARASATLTTALASRPSSVNPLLSNFEDLVIPIEALRLPGISVHDHKSFRRCKFVGPGALALLGGTFLRSSFNNPGHLLPLPEEVFLTGVTALRGCTVEDCGFYSVTLLVPKQMVSTFESSIPGVQVAKY